MNYYRVRRQVLAVDAGGARVEVSMPVLEDGIVFETLHDFGDERGLIIGTEGVVADCFEGFDIEDDVVASHLRWNAENPCDGAGKFVLNNGFVEAGS